LTNAGCGFHPIGASYDQRTGQNELEEVHELHLKAAFIPNYIERQTGSDICYHTLGLNSEHDYHPFGGVVVSLGYLF
jgi:hypothetical protein